MEATYVMISCHSLSIISVLGTIPGISRTGAHLIFLTNLLGTYYCPDFRGKKPEAQAPEVRRARIHITGLYKIPKSVFFKPYCDGSKIVLHNVNGVRDWFELVPNLNYTLECVCMYFSFLHLPPLVSFSSFFSQISL